jgi:hypothetical protein
LSEQPIPETCSASGTRSGQLLGFLFGLAPDGVFRASAIALGAVGFYPAFSPLPLASQRRSKFLWHCPSKVFKLSPACIPCPKAKVTRHRALWSSDFPPPACAGSDSPPFQNHSESITVEWLRQDGKYSQRSKSLPISKENPQHEKTDYDTANYEC